MEHLDILITDDTPEKITALKNVLVNTCSIDVNDIDIADNINDARNLMREKLYHLLIIDMVLPQMKDLQAEVDAGVKFIEDIYVSDAIKKPVHIIGLTQYEENYNQLQQDLADKLWYLVLYRNDSTDWKDRIKNKVFQILKIKKDLETSILDKNKFDFGIICALRDEFEAMKMAFGKDVWKKTLIEGFPLDIYCTEIKSAYNNNYRICAATPCRPGVVATASLAVSMYNILKVDAIFMTGYAAGIKRDDLDLGSLVIAQSVQEYAAGKIVKGEETELYTLLKEVHYFPAAPDLINKASEMIELDACLDDINKFVKDVTSDRFSVKATTAPSVCVPFVVASKEAMEEIKKDDRKLAALDMEGFGLYYAAYFLNKKALWIKGICDFGDEKKDDSYHKKSALASGKFLYWMIRESMW